MPTRKISRFPTTWMCLLILISQFLNAESPIEGKLSSLEVEIRSTVDGTHQKAILALSKSETHPKPLLVALHSWSGNYLQASGRDYLKKAMELNWHFIHPDFRGINQRPESTCSDLVVSDVLDAVEFVKKKAKVDSQRIYLVGASGGGMASLMLAAKAPDVWAGVSSWVPISNLMDWHKETMDRNLKYSAMIESSCGGKPNEHAAVNFQYWNRSPINFLTNAKTVNLDINAGIMDGHTGSVPVGHSLRAFNELASQANQFTHQQIRFIETKAEIPTELINETLEDLAYGEKQPLLRRLSGKSRITLFQGSHEIIMDAAIDWLSQQKK